MTQGVGRGRANDAGGGDGAFEGTLKRLIEEMMPTDDSCSRAGGVGALREHPEPRPGMGRTRILALDGIGHLHAAALLASIGLPQAMGQLLLLLQCGLQGGGQHDHAVFIALAFAHDDG